MSSPQPPRGKDAALARHVLSVATQNRRLFPRRDTHGLEPNAAQVLLALMLENDRTVTQLASELLLAKTTVSHAVADLQRQGLVRERAQANDRRQQLQRLTPSGNRAARRLVGLLGERLQAK